jgi:N-acetylmuramoyl-L-alanine amidase
MKSLVIAVLAVLAVPSTALAGTTLVTREVRVADARAGSATQARFDLVGVHWRGPGRVYLRTRSVSGRWSGWHAADPEGDDLPDVGSREARASSGWKIGNPWWAGTSNAVQYRFRGRVDRLRAFLISSPEERLPLRRISVTGSPAIVMRTAWGANEAIRRAPPAYADAVRYAVVHHTAGPSSYSAAQSAAIVRSIELYHVQGNGWNDIGYNFLVDRFGQIFEGRYGGVDRAVVGAHAQGFNTGSAGIAVIGTYSSSPISPAARDALVRLLAWRLDLAHVDPLSTLAVTSGGNPKYPSGESIFLRAVSGHRDTGFTSCPGNALYAQIPAVARDATATGLPKLYAPSVRGKVGGPIRFTARLSTVLPWTVTVSDSTGAVVASGTGSGTAVDWTWDATLAPVAPYAYSIDAGPTVRPARGTIGGRIAALALNDVRASLTTFSPNGDGRDEETTIFYTLTTQATVSAALTLAEGTPVSTLFTDVKPAGRNSFVFRAQGLPDGRYAIVLTATVGTKQVSATVPIVVNRTLAGVGASPSSFSPNGDGRKDTAGIVFSLARPVQAQLRVLLRGAPVANVFAGPLAAGQQRLAWTGRGDDGRALVDGSYRAELSVTDELGTVTSTVPLRLDTRAPTVRLWSSRPLRVRVSEPGTLTVRGAGRVFVVRVRRAGVVAVGSTARRLTLVAEDAAANRSKPLRIG